MFFFSLLSSPPPLAPALTFAYNDNFNHSTWLTFMKNRLEVAKDLLKDDGVIFVQCDDNEQAYLKVLMDKIFEGNFLNTISVKAKVSAGASGGGEDKRLKKNIEYIHCYFNKDFVVFNDVYKETEIVSYIQQMKNDGKSFISFTASPSFLLSLVNRFQFTRAFLSKSLSISS